MGIRLALIIGLAVASCIARAEIYKTVDANGNVVFTDIAPVDRSGVAAPQPITVQPMNTFESTTAPVATEDTDDDGTPAQSYYTQLNVTSPAPDEGVRDNAGNVEIQVELMPALRAGHRLLLVFDGDDTEIEAVSGGFTLTNVERGTHTAAAKVVDRRGNVLIESPSTTFNVLRYAPPQAVPTPLPQPKPKPQPSRPRP